MTMATPGEFSRRTAVALISAVFVVAGGYGILLPVLPSTIANLAGSQADTATHTGLVLGLYLLSLAIFAPLWGRISDRVGRRPVLLVGLLGLGASALILSIPSSLTSLYGERFLSGMFAAGIVPVALATMGESAATEAQRAQRISWISMASIAGFLLGPAFGGAVAGFLSVSDSFASGREAVLTVSFIVIAVLSVLAALSVYVFVPAESAKSGLKRFSPSSALPDRVLVLMLGLSFLAAGGLGVFEVGVTLQGQRAFGATPFQTAMVFAECSIAMFLAQAIVFSSLLKADATRWLIAPALLLMASGIAAIPSTGDFALLLVWVGLVAVGAGILLPVITYWVSRRAADNQGADLGKQTAAANLGQALGTGVGGTLFTLSFIPGASFVVTAILLALGAAIGAGLSRALSQSASPETRPRPSAIAS